MSTTYIPLLEPSVPDFDGDDDAPPNPVATTVSESFAQIERLLLAIGDDLDRCRMRLLHAAMRENLADFLAWFSAELETLVSLECGHPIAGWPVKTKEIAYVGV
jgi:hypothetical protein